jgi:hypothetical protein
MTNQITMTYLVQFTAQTRAKQQTVLAALALGSADGTLAALGLQEDSKAVSLQVAGFQVVQVVEPIDPASFNASYPTNADAASLVNNLWVAVFAQQVNMQASQVSVVVS